MPAPVDTGTTIITLSGPPTKAPGALVPGPGSTGTAYTAPTPSSPPETAPPAVVPGAGTGQTTTAAATPTPPVIELPVNITGGGGGNPVIPRPVPNYIEVLANGEVVVQNATALNFTGTGVSITANGAVATLTITSGGGATNKIVNGTSYANIATTNGNVTIGAGGNIWNFDTTGNITLPSGPKIISGYPGGGFISNVATLAGDQVYLSTADGASWMGIDGGIPRLGWDSTGKYWNFGSDGTLSAAGNIITAANISGSYILGNGSQLTGLTATYGNANVAANLAAFGSNPISTSGNITGGNIINSGISTVTGNITGGNLLTGGLISATGNITGGNVLGGANVNATTHTGTTVSVSANVTGGNILTGGIISAAGNVTGGNVLTAGILSATGNVTGNFFIGNGSQLTGLAATYGNANVVANLAALGTNPVSTTGNITGGNITLSTLVTANSVVSRLLTITSSVSNVLLDATSSQNILVNGSTSQYVFLPNAQTLTTGATYWFNDNSSQPVYICYNDGTLLGTLAAGGLIEVQLLTNSTSNGTWDRHSGIPSYVGWGSTGLTMGNGNITGATIISASANVTGGNVLTGGLISATGNITGGNVLGGANVNATTHTGTTVSVSANVTGGNILTGGLISATGNVNVGNLINAGLTSVTGNITGGNILTGGLISATGNITGGNVLGGANVNATTHTGTTVSVTANITGGNVLFGSGIVSGTGNITGGNLTIAGNTATITTANISIGYLNIPQISFAANATAALVDSGKHYYTTSASNLALTLADNSAVSWPVGTALSVINRGTANVTVAPAAGVSLYLAGNSTSANRVVTTYGMATVMNVASNVWMINGTVV